MDGYIESPPPAPASPTFRPEAQSSGFYDEHPSNFEYSTRYSMDDYTGTNMFQTSSEIDPELLAQINAGDVPHIIEFPPNYQFPEG